MPLDKQRIVHVPRDHACLVLDHIAQVVDDVDTSAARRGCWLQNPVVVPQGAVAARLNLAVAHQNLAFDGIVLLVEALAESVPFLR